MDDTGYIALSRQAGLLRELSIVANNVANASTTGFRREGLIFSEVVRDVPNASGIAMTTARTRFSSEASGAMSATGGRLDLAIDGPGYFLVLTPEGERVTRAGAFRQGADGTMVTADGNQLLDLAGAPIFLPPGADISVATDGTISADGQPLAQIGLVQPDAIGIARADGVLFAFEGIPAPVLEPAIRQGFLETSNVNPVAEIARLIEIQRAYEQGQSFLDAEDARTRDAVRALGRVL